MFDLKERHDTTDINLDTNKNFFSDSSIVDVFLFVFAIILLLVTQLAIFYCVNTRNLEC